MSTGRGNWDFSAAGISEAGCTRDGFFLRRNFRPGSFMIASVLRGSKISTFEERIVADRGQNSIYEDI